MDKDIQISKCLHTQIYKYSNTCFFDDRSSPTLTGSDVQAPNRRKRCCLCASILIGVGPHLIGFFCRLRCQDNHQYGSSRLVKRIKTCEHCSWAFLLCCSFVACYSVVFLRTKKHRQRTAPRPQDLRLQGR